MTRFATFALAVAVPVLWLTATEQGTSGVKKLGGPVKMPGPTKAICIIQSLSGSNVGGVVYFTQTGDMVQVKGKITGLTPGLHGFHVHEFGDLSSKDGLSTGGHFNPEGDPHGAREAHKRHVGDLGNVKADESGKAVIDLDDDQLSFEGPNCILGRGLVVHEKADDLKTDPAGNAGGRLAVAIIGVARP